MNLPDDYTIRLIDLPIGVGGFMDECPDGHVDVYVNARLSHDGQFDAAEHEFRHWENDDLTNSKDIQTVERDADGPGGHPRLPVLMRASQLPRPGRRHDKASDLIEIMRRDNWKNDWYLKMDDADYW